MVSCIISFLPWLREQADWHVLERIKSPYEFCFSANINQFSGGQVPMPFFSLSLSLCGRWSAKTKAILDYKSTACVCLLGSKIQEQIEPPVFNAPCWADVQAISPAGVIKPGLDLSSSYPRREGAEKKLLASNGVLGLFYINSAQAR